MQILCILTPDPAHDIGFQSIACAITSEGLQRQGEKVESVSRSSLAQELLPDGARGRNRSQSA